MKKDLTKVKFDGKEFYYFTFGDKVIYVAEEFIGNYISPILLDEHQRPYVEFPLKDAELIIAKNIGIIKRGYSNLFFVRYNSHGGSADIKIIDEIEHVERVNIFDEKEGIDNQLLIQTKGDVVEISFNVFYGSPPKGLSKFYVDGREEILPYVEVEDYPLLYQEASTEATAS